MPLYDIEHITPLTTTEQQALAQALTKLHAERFHTPSMFLNVRFHDVSATPTYRGGVLVQYNRAILRTRRSEDKERSVDVYNQHCRDVVRVWGGIVGETVGRQLRTVWVLGALTTAVEAGFARPMAGDEISWLREHKTEFQKLADEGDEEFAGLMQEIETREDFKEAR